MITQELAAYGYLIAAICFIMALRGLSSPVTSRGGNLYGIVGMVVAIGVTVATPGVVSPWLIVGGLLIGGAIGTVIALRIQMTALPQLVAAFHSLVGLAAVFVASAAFVSPDAFGIGSPGHIKTQSLIEMGLGTIIGAITFTGSIVAFAKLQGLVSGAPLVFRGQHPLNALIGIVIVVLLVWFALRGHP
ncbi:MAG TPA: NAD(P)(+) transhydrogenase (Re/Si-specific) subunit beta, partial [Reyranella sp.]|nr:NAD(P)(+) transhydrogenase (Re/Si-specific) subunit beta [Reyranella sp.]